MKTQRGFAGILGLVIVIVIVIGGAWLVTQNSSLETGLPGDATEEAGDNLNFKSKATLSKTVDNRHGVEVVISDQFDRAVQTINVSGVDSILTETGNANRLVSFVKTGSESYPSLLLVQVGVGATGNQTYVYRLYDREKGVFVCGEAQNDDSSWGKGSRENCDVMNIVWDAEKQILSGRVNNGCAGTCYIKTEYVIDDGKLVASAEIEQAISDQEKPTFVRIYRKMVGGVMVEQSRINVSEGELWEI